MDCQRLPPYGTRQSAMPADPYYSAFTPFFCSLHLSYVGLVSYGSARLSALGPLLQFRRISVLLGVSEWSGWPRVRGSTW